jgi:hypothetical protein
VGDRRRANQRREQCALRLRRIVNVHGFPRHQQGQLRIRFVTRTGGEASGVRERQRLRRSIALNKRQIADHERRREQRRDADEEPAQSAVRSTRPDGFALRCGATRLQERMFEFVQIRLMGICPFRR